MLADHSLNQLFALGDYVTFLRFLKQRRTSDLNNNLYLVDTRLHHVQLLYSCPWINKIQIITIANQIYYAKLEGNFDRYIYSRDLKSGN